MGFYRIQVFLPPALDPMATTRPRFQFSSLTFFALDSFFYFTPKS